MSMKRNCYKKDRKQSFEEMMNAFKKESKEKMKTLKKREQGKCKKTEKGE